MVDEPLLVAARDVAAVFRDEAWEGEKARQLTDTALAAVKDSGLFSTLVPERFGGSEVDFHIIPQLIRELAKGDTSSAWVTAFLIHHNWQFALYPLETQEELWADRNYALAPATLAPTGRAERVDGGWKLSGRWQWGTGVMHSQWALVTAIAAFEEKDEVALMLLPMEDVEVVDVWHTEGMRATGSNDMIIEEAFVPDRRAITYQQISKREAPGQLVSPNPLYRLDMLALLSLDATATSVGAGERSLELFTERLYERKLMFGGQQKDSSTAQVRLARAASVMRTARLMFDAAVQDLCAPLRDEPYPSPAKRVRIRMDCAHVVDLVKQVLVLINDGAGASSHFLDSPLQRFRRDVLTLSGHILFDYDRAAELQGQMMLGIKPPSGTLF
ncbi:MAG: hypothetical protein NZ605_12185 [Acidimicrobiales bacterium]|nr:hypothetical protein [Acidimicrobiales bacterium]